MTSLHAHEAQHAREAAFAPPLPPAVEPRVCSKPPKQADTAPRFFLKCRWIRDTSRELHAVYTPASGIYSLFIRALHFHKNILNERCRTGETILIFQFFRMH
jgi:hypothetical protein